MMPYINCKSDYFTNRQGVRIHTVEWKRYSSNYQALIYICHGYYEHMLNDYFETLAKPFCQMGYIVAGNDYRGHGRSGNPKGQIGDVLSLALDMKQNIDSLRRKYRIPLIIYGYSLGSIVSILYTQLLSRDIVRGLILESPVLKMHPKLVSCQTLCMGALMKLFCPKSFLNGVNYKLDDPFRENFLEAHTSKIVNRSMAASNKIVRNWYQDKGNKKKLPIYLKPLKGRLPKNAHYHLQAPTNVFIGVGRLDDMCDINEVFKLFPSNTVNIYESSGHHLRYDDVSDCDIFINDIECWVTNLISNIKHDA